MPSSRSRSSSNSSPSAAAVAVVPTHHYQNALCCLQPLAHGIVQQPSIAHASSACPAAVPSTYSSSSSRNARISSSTVCSAAGTKAAGGAIDGELFCVACVHVYLVHVEVVCLLAAAAESCSCRCQSVALMFTQSCLSLSRLCNISTHTTTQQQQWTRRPTRYLMRQSSRSGVSAVLCCVVLCYCGGREGR